MDRYVVAGLLGRLGWLAGNGVEARRRTIERWAADPPASVMTPGRPPFFYALVGPPTVAATAGAVLRGPEDPLVAASAVATATALGVTVVLVRTVVLPLRVGAVDRDAAVRRWYVLNRGRMLLVAAAVAGDLRVLARP